MKLMICGYARHGKDTVGELLEQELDITFDSSSMFACKLFLFDALKVKYGYNTPQEAFEDRGNHRKEWFDMICAYNADDPSRLTREIFAQHDMYVGIRNRIEFLDAREKNLFDLSIWVDAAERKPPESGVSNTVSKDLCDIILDNNSDENTLKRRVKRLAACLR